MCVVQHLVEGAGEALGVVDVRDPRGVGEEVGQVVGDEGVERRAELVGEGVVHEAEPGERGRYPDVRGLRGVGPEGVGPGGGVGVVVLAGEFGDGQDEARPDCGDLFDGQAGVEGVRDAGGFTGGGGQGVAGRGAEPGVRVVKEREEQVGRW